MVQTLPQFLAALATDAELYGLFLEDPVQLLAQYVGADDAAAICGGDLDTLSGHLAAATSQTPYQAPRSGFGQPVFMPVYDVEVGAQVWLHGVIGGE